ncbi:uncharacterized protein LOC124494581 isoform X2 [Dermatophagoides farinae]|uniref:uncharacterized protein LOC124494581 isoform X2 n=1 Tax=Dermatophagoides farinae TaxID=6954 RepID=UPI003F5FD514
MVSKLMAFFECDGIINNDNNNNKSKQQKLDQNNKSSIIGQIQLYSHNNNDNYYYYHCGKYSLIATKNRKLNHIPEVEISAPATLSVATTTTITTVVATNLQNKIFSLVQYLLFVIICLFIMIETIVAADITTTTTMTTSVPSPLPFFVTSVPSISPLSASPSSILWTMINSSSSLNIRSNNNDDNDNDNNNKSSKLSSAIMTKKANNKDIVLILMRKPNATTHSPLLVTTTSTTTLTTKNTIPRIENNFTTMATTPFLLWQQKNVNDDKNEAKDMLPTIIKTISPTILSSLSSLSPRPSSNTINPSSPLSPSLQLTTKDIINLETTTTATSLLKNKWNKKQKLYNNITAINDIGVPSQETMNDKLFNIQKNNTILTGSDIISKEKSIPNDYNSRLDNFVVVDSTIVPNVSAIDNDDDNEASDEMMMIMPSSSSLHRIHRRRHNDNDYNDTIQINHNNNVSDVYIVVDNNYPHDRIIKKDILPLEQQNELSNQTAKHLIIDKQFNNNQTTNFATINFIEKYSNTSDLMIMLSDASSPQSNTTNDFLQQHNIYRYYSQRQENDLKTLLSRYPSLRLPPPPPEYADDFDPGITEVSTVSGSSVDIPCNTTWIEDEVSLVLWFRGDTGVPIYRVDARNVPLSKAIHTTSDESRKRLYFDMKQQPPVLRIKPVMASDAAEYRCRVDFRQSRTQNVIVLLNVTVPPKELLIMDVEGQKLEGVIGPYDEGSNVILICEAEGGKPSPSVNWYQANRLIDSTYTIGPHGLVRNELNIRNLNRSDFMSILTCRASNNNVTEPISATVILDMNLRPIDVKILPKSYLKSKSSSSSSSHNGSITSSTTFMIDPRLSFILPAGSKAEFQCQSTGSRPAAQISWWLGNERLSSNVRDSVNEDGNATVSTIVFVPSVEDNGKLLTCRADNLPMPHTALKDERLLNVQFAPQLRISFGTNIQIDSIREGSDVYMECHVKANPPVKEVVWLHEDRPIHSLMSGDPNMLPDDPTLPTLSSSLSMAIGSTVIMTNQSLVIQKVHRSHRGRYQCVAFNEQGETVSDPLYLKVNFAPSCKPGQKLQYGVSRNEQIRIRCEVDAEPSTDLTFRWTLNTSGSGETSVEWASFTVNATTSIATYRPESSLDYGTLSCLAQNSIGIQNKPCIYSVVPAGRPDAVRGCAITNHSMSTLLVECIPGDDGGLRQHFNLEVYIGSTTNLGSSSNIGNGATIINANNKVVDQTLAAQSASIATTTTTTSINSNSLLQHPQRLHSNHSSSQPNFIVSSLTPGTPYTLVLYATNAKGRSHSVSLSAVTLSSPEKHTARGSFEQIVVHPILGILIGIVATIVITVIILILLIRSRIGGNNNANGSRSTGINNCSGNNNGHNNHNDNNHRKRRNNKQQKQSPQSSSSSPSTKTTVAFTRPSLNGTNSTMMMATTTANNNNNNNADDDDNNIDGSIDLSANDALLAIGSTISPSIITSNGDMKLKRIKHEQTSSSSSTLHHESKDLSNMLFKKKSPSKKQQQQFQNQTTTKTMITENSLAIFQQKIQLSSKLIRPSWILMAMMMMMTMMSIYVIKLNMKKYALSVVPPTIYKINAIKCRYIIQSVRMKNHYYQQQLRIQINN